MAGAPSVGARSRRCGNGEKTGTIEINKGIRAEAAEHSNSKGELTGIGCYSFKGGQGFAAAEDTKNYKKRV